MSLKKELIIVLILLAVFLGLKINSFTYAISDENTYYLMGKTVSEGQMMYTDFFFSHPPLQIILFAFLIKLFGFSFVMLKATSTIAVAITGFFTYKIIEERIGWKEGILGMSLFLFSYDTLRFSSYPTGVDITVLFLIISFYCLLNNRFLISGIFSGLAAISGLYSLIAIVIFGLFIVLKHKEGLARFWLGFFAIFGLTNLLFFFLAGPSYFEQVYFYHLMKPDEASNKAELIQRLVTANILLWGSALLFILSERKLKKELFISAGVIASYWAFFIVSNKVFAYYMLLAFPFVAVLGAYSIMNISRGISKRGIFALALITIAISGMASAYQFMTYDYQNFTEAEEIAAYIRQNSVEGDAIYGEESITPLLSILSGRAITLNHIDSNALRFKSKVTDINETISGLNKTKFFIAYKLNVGEGRLSYGVTALPEFEQFVAQNCAVSKVFTSEWRAYTKEYYVYDCLQS